MSLLYEEGEFWIGRTPYGYFNLYSGYILLDVFFTFQQAKLALCRFRDLQQYKQED